MNRAERLKRLGERGEILMERAAGEPVLLRQREISKPQLQLFGSGLLIKPVPARPRQLEFHEETERHAVFQGLQQRSRQIQAKIRIQGISRLREFQSDIIHLDGLGERRRREGKRRGGSTKACDHVGGRPFVSKA